MLKKISATIICLAITSFLSSADPHGFTWFGFRNNDTEVFINSSSHNTQPCPANHHHPKKPKKHKHKPKHEKHPQTPHKNCFWWWCK